MEFVNIAAVLVRRRLLVAVGLLPACVVAALLTGVLGFGPGARDAAPPTGTARARVVVDYDTAVVVDVKADAEVVGRQAALLSDLVTSDQARDAIARRIGVAPDAIAMRRDQLVAPVAPDQLAIRGGEAAATGARPYRINVWAATPVPILTIDVAAPTSSAAERAAVVTRQALLAILVARAPTASRGLVIKTLGPVRTHDVAAARARPPAAGVAAGVAFFVFWCCGVVVLSGLRRAWGAVGNDPPARATAQGA